MLFKMLKLLVILLLSIPTMSADSSRPKRYKSTDSHHDSSTFNQKFEQPAVKSLSSIDGTLASDVGTQVGEDIIVTKTGHIEVLLNGDSLEFGICADDCNGKVKICYDVLKRNPNAVVSSECGPSQCEFFVGKDATNFLLMGSTVPKQVASGCGSMQMKDGLHTMLNAYGYCCDPKIGQNGYMNLEVVLADPQCPLQIKHAIITIGEPTTTTTLPLSSSTPSSSIVTTTEGTESAQILWIVLGVVLGIFVLFVVIVVIVLLWKRWNKRRKGAPKIADVPPPEENEAGKTNEGTVDTQEIPAEIEHPKEEQAAPKEVKKEAKSKSVQSKAPIPSAEPTQPKPTVDATQQPPFETATTQPSAEKAPKTQLVLNKVTYPEPSRLVVKSLKSHKTDSLQGILQKNMKVLIEAPWLSLSRFDCLGEHEYYLMEKMESRYPLMVREDYDREIDLFCVPISEMYKEMNKFAVEAEEGLKKNGVQFDSKKRITHMTITGLEYIRRPDILESVAYFTFGADFHKYVGADFELIAKVSIPLLYVVAMQPRFSEFNRRKACTWIRRQVAKVRKSYTPAEREVMPFPINIIEKAYQKNPKYFDDLDALKTMSDVKAVLSAAPVKDIHAPQHPNQEMATNPTQIEESAAAVNHQGKSKKKKKSKSKSKKSTSKNNHRKQ